MDDAGDCITGLLEVQNVDTEWTYVVGRKKWIGWLV